MLRKKYLNKKYLFSKNGPLDEETQNLVSESIHFFIWIEKFIKQLNRLKDIGENRWLEGDVRRLASKFAYYIGKEVHRKKTDQSLDSNVSRI